MKVIFQIAIFSLKLLILTVTSEMPSHYLTQNSADTSGEQLQGPNNYNSCPCDLSSYCDYRCCCDEKCDAKDWRQQGICLNKEKKNYNSEFLCTDDKKLLFKYNSLKAGITIKDHIFNIMCMKYDRTKSMFKFYDISFSTAQNKLESLYSKWKDSLTAHDESKDNLVYIETGFSIYKPDSNGNCIKTQHIYYFKPIETICYGNSKEIKNEISKNKKCKLKENDTGNLNEVQYIIYYNYTNSTTSDNFICYYIPLSSETEEDRPIKFKVKWINIASKNPKLSGVGGYLQGMPVLIKINGTFRFENGFYVHGADKNGKCGGTLKNPTDPVISFKKDLIYSCWTDNTEYVLPILNFKSISIAKYGDKKINEDDEWIDINESDYNEAKNNISNCLGKEKGINIFLGIITSKKGYKNSQKMYIENATINSVCNEKVRNVISFFVRFSEISYKLYENKINGKFSSFASLPHSLIQSQS